MTSSKRINKPLFYFLFVIMMGSSIVVQAQEIAGEVPEILEQQLEEMTEANEDMETEDDSYLQDLVHFLKEPLNLNYADEGLLKELHLLSPVQISNLISYRKLMGNFLSIYELQAIPSWDLELIRKLRPYITVAEKTLVLKSLNDRLKTGESTVLFRISQVLEKSKGYLSNSSNASNFYPGSPQKSLIRYKYKSGNLLQYGFTAEKDAGESFFKGAQKNGFDFYSAHFFVRKLGIIKSLAIGDFNVNMGQGLTQWQSIAFNKGAEIINAKRQSDVLRPYNSAGEMVFNRGVGITLQQKNWETASFLSYRKIDGNFHPG
ncbi:MAG TPA: helix-hairpin-helix domain-containing protein, partial [Hanamia sp.]